MDFSRQQQNKQPAAAAWLQPQPCSNKKLVFHNLCGYDSYLLVKRVKPENSTNDKIRAIACNEEKYISFSKELVLDS
jgi:hypothetical protein